ncbi:MAG: flagellar hook-associated protein FlgK [Marinosulfonomonas sp.]
MSISGSLSNAMSGLNVASRAAEVVSANVANAMTDGYGRRELETSSLSLGGNGAGVSVTGIQRAVDQPTIAQRRLAQASLGADNTRVGFYSRLETAIGMPDDPKSLTGQIATLEASLIEASSRPDSETRLNIAVTAAKDLAGKFNAISTELQALRMEADQSISNKVTVLNDNLAKISKMNHDIRQFISGGQDVSALMDQRQKLIDDVSGIVPLREIQRDHGQVALFTPGGAILVDGKAVTIGFSPVGVIVPEMSLGSGALSGLSINGQPVRVDGNGPLAGGSLAADFAVRDEHAVNMQAKLDALARDMIERFQDPATDPTLSATDAGLFTDGGTFFSATNEVGVAGRLSINGLVDPAMGGAVWKLRDGLGASVPGNVGQATVLQSLSAALEKSNTPSSGSFGSGTYTSASFAAEFLTQNNQQLQHEESDQAFNLARYDTLKTSELSQGVDTDHEMQRLLLIEQTYSANARVITTIDQMIQTLLGM